MATPFTPPSQMPEEASSGSERSRFLTAIGFARSSLSEADSAPVLAGVGNSPSSVVTEPAKDTGGNLEWKPEAALATEVLAVPKAAAQDRLSVPQPSTPDGPRTPVLPFLPLETSHGGQDSRDLLELLGLDADLEELSETTDRAIPNSESEAEDVALSGDVGPDFLASKDHSIDPLESDWLAELTSDESAVEKPMTASGPTAVESAIRREPVSAMPWLNTKSKATSHEPTAVPVAGPTVSEDTKVNPAPVVEAEVVAPAEKTTTSDPAAAKAGVASAAMPGAAFSFAGLRDRIAQEPAGSSASVLTESVPFQWKPGTTETSALAETLPLAETIVPEQKEPSPLSDAAALPAFGWSQPSPPPEVSEGEVMPPPPVPGFQWSPPEAAPIEKPAPNPTSVENLAGNIPSASPATSAKPAFSWAPPEDSVLPCSFVSSLEPIDEAALLFADDEVPAPAKGFGETLGELAVPSSLSPVPAMATVPAPDSPMPIMTPGGIVDVSCPQCAKGLSLRHEHLGISGNCVWCSTPIVATADGNGAVSVLVLSETARSEPEMGAVKAEPAPSSLPGADEAFSWTPQNGTSFSPLEHADAASTQVAPVPSFDLPEIPASGFAAAAPVDLAANSASVAAGSAFEMAAEVAPSAPTDAFASAFAPPAPKTSAFETGPAFEKLSEFLDAPSNTAPVAAAGIGSFGSGSLSESPTREMAAKSLFSAPGPVTSTMLPPPAETGITTQSAGASPAGAVVESEPTQDKETEPAKGKTKKKRERKVKAPKAKTEAATSAKKTSRGVSARKWFWTIALLGLAAGIGVSAYSWKSLEAQVWPRLEPLLKNVLSFTSAAKGEPVSAAAEAEPPAPAPVAPAPQVKSTPKSPEIPQAVPPRPAFSSEPLKFNDEALQEPRSSK